MKAKQNIQICWFRRDLRLEDNAAWYYALQNNDCPVLALFIFDKNILSTLPSSYDKRVDAIHQIVDKLNKQLISLGTILWVEYGEPEKIFEQLFNQFSVKSLHLNKDYEPYATKRDASIYKIAKQYGVNFMEYKDEVIFEPGEITKTDGKPYTVFTPYSKVWYKKIEKKHFNSFDTSINKNNVLKMPAQSILSLDDIGFKATDFIYKEPQIPNKIIAEYDKTRNFPSIKGTSELSFHLRFGTISIRKLSYIAYNTNQTFLNELIWREFFMSILYFFPQVTTQSFKPLYDNIAWLNDEQSFEKWCQGKTGYPLVDAGMRQLNETGWMHNRVRMVVAGFLCKHLLIDWRWGEAYFAEKLLDYDLAANNGNWQWAAGSGCDAAPYFRIFNPSEQIKKFDPDYIYIKQWVKEIFTNKYPLPIVEHSVARNRAIIVYKAALSDFEV